jgi:hypothetical protein
MKRALSAIGFHGTSKSNYEGIKRQGFLLSDNSYDWLGVGFYFFQDAPNRAKEWAKRHEDPIIIGAEISLDHCMDLLDNVWYELLHRAFIAYEGACRKKNIPMAIQTPGNHRRDKIVIDMAVRALAERGFLVKTVRSVFKEGPECFQNSALTTQNHVQIAVRDISTIVDFWSEELN